eukprot:6863925-Pyramimonas_sp.AAC.1
MHCEFETHALFTACHVHVYDACAAAPGRLSHVGAQHVVHTYWVYDAVNTPGVHYRCMVCACVRVRACVRLCGRREKGRGGKGGGMREV